MEANAVGRVTDVVTREEHEEFVKRMEAEHKRQSKRLETVEKRQDDLDKLVAAMATVEQKQADMETDLKEIKTDVKALTDKPGKRWEQLVATIIATVVGAVLGVLLAQLGMG